MRSERAADAAAVLGFCRAPDNDHVIATSGTSHGRTVKCSIASEDNTFRANWPRPVPFVGQRLGLASVSWLSASVSAWKAACTSLAKCYHNGRRKATLTQCFLVSYSKMVHRTRESLDGSILPPAAVASSSLATTSAAAWRRNERAAAAKWTHLSRPRSPSSHTRRFGNKT